MGSNPSGGRSAGPALEGQLGPGLTGGDPGAPLEGLLGEQPAPLAVDDVQMDPRRKRFQDFWSRLGLSEGGPWDGYGGIGESRIERGFGNGSRSK